MDTVKRHSHQSQHSWVAVWLGIALSWRRGLLCCRERNLVRCHGKCIISWRISAAAVSNMNGFAILSNANSPALLLCVCSQCVSAGVAVFTFWLSGVSPGAVEVWVATPLADGLHLTPERVQAQFVGVLLLILGGERVRAVCVLSGCLVLRAGPGLHAHLGGAGVSGAHIHTRKEIARTHANKRAEAQRHVQPQEERRKD